MKLKILICLLALWCLLVVAACSDEAVPTAKKNSAPVNEALNDLIIVCNNMWDEPYVCDAVKIKQYVGAWWKKSPIGSVTTYADMGGVRIAMKKTEELGGGYMDAFSEKLDKALANPYDEKFAPANVEYLPASLAFENGVVRSNIKRTFESGVVRSNVKHTLLLLATRYDQLGSYYQVPYEVPAKRDLVHFAVVCDISKSAANYCRNQIIYALKKFISVGGGLPDDEFDVYLVGTNRETVLSIYGQSFSRSIYYGDRVVDALQIIRKIYKGANKNKNLDELIQKEFKEGKVRFSLEKASAIAEAVSLAAQNLNEVGGRRYMYVISDGRQVTPDKVNFEAGLPERGEFTRWVGSEFPHLDLSKINVTMCGLHNNQSNEGDVPGIITEDYSVRLIAMWREMFISRKAVNPSVSNLCDINN
jgi:hypothetical protein